MWGSDGEMHAIVFANNEEDAIKLVINNELFDQYDDQWYDEIIATELSGEEGIAIVNDEHLVLRRISHEEQMERS